MIEKRLLYGTATVGTKGQLVIPAPAREEFGIKSGDKIYVLGSSKKGVIMLLQEEKMEKFIEHINLHLENFKNIKQPKDK